MGHISEEEMKKRGFGEEYIKLKIPKKTDVLIVTTVSQGINRKYKYNFK